MSRRKLIVMVEKRPDGSPQPVSFTAVSPRKHLNTTFKSSASYRLIFVFVFAVAGDDVIRLDTRLIPQQRKSGRDTFREMLEVPHVQLLLEHRMFPCGGKWNDLTLELTVFNPIIICWRFFRKEEKMLFKIKLYASVKPN